MPDWSGVLSEIEARSSVHMILTGEYMKKLHEVTGRNIVIYYSAWLEKGALASKGASFEITDVDMNGFMNAFHGLDKDLGLDLVLHTPGGSANATEAIVNYIKSIFGTNVRAIVPQMAMSAGTMISCACSEILMGCHSSIGPIDPQFGGLAAEAIIEEFDEAKKEIARDPSTIPVYQVLLSKYQPTLVIECRNAKKQAAEMVKKWLMEGMFKEMPDAEGKADFVLEALASHANTKSHGRHITKKQAIELGLVVKSLEDDQQLQEAVLSVHHAATISLTQTKAVKLISNHNGKAFVNNFG